LAETFCLASRPFFGVLAGRQSLSFKTFKTQEALIASSAIPITGPVSFRRVGSLGRSSDGIGFFIGMSCPSRESEGKGND